MIAQACQNTWQRDTVAFTPLSARAARASIWGIMRTRGSTASLASWDKVPATSWKSTRWCDTFSEKSDLPFGAIRSQICAEEAWIRVE